MPGIVGIISRKSPHECQQCVTAMVQCLRHELFYATGTHFEPELGFYSGWAAHENAPGALQPFVSADRTVILLFSGECTVDTGEAHGGPLETKLGQTIVALYEKHGIDFLKKLNGLFSGLLIDTRSQRAFLFNDRYGMERIYYHASKDAFYFASEAKALLRILPELRSFDERGVAQFLAFGCTQDQQTLFKGISLAPGGTLWTIAPSVGLKMEKYFAPDAWEKQTPLSADEFDEEFTALFRRIMPKYVGSGKDLGISLTGGLDSRMVMAGLPPTTARPKCYTYSGQNHDVLDTRIAARIAATCGLEHHTLRIGSEYLAQFPTHLDRTVYITDGCAGATGAHEIYLNTAGRKLGTIRMTGNYGSEVLRAVSTFKPLRLESSLLAEGWRTRVAEAATSAPHHNIHPVTFSAFREIPWSLIGTLLAGRSQVTFRSPFMDNELVALAYRTPLGQRTSPIPALRLIQRCSPALAAIPTDRGVIGESRGPAFQARRIFAEVTFKLDYMHKEGLPSALSPFAPLLNALDHTGLLGLHKFLAYRRWFQNELNPQIAAVLSDRRTREMPFWNRDSLEPMLAEHVGGRRNRVKELNAILTLEAIDRLLLSAPAAP